MPSTATETEARNRLLDTGALAIKASLYADREVNLAISDWLHARERIGREGFTAEAVSAFERANRTLSAALAKRFRKQIGSGRIRFGPEDWIRAKSERN